MELLQVIHTINTSFSSVRIGYTSHTRDYAQDIVVSGEYLNFSYICGVGAEDQLSIINTAEVACSRWLMFFGFKSERIDIYSWFRNKRNTSMMLEWLNH